MKVISAALLAVALTFVSFAVAADTRYEIPFADSPTFGPAEKFTESIDGKKYAQAIERDKDLAVKLAVFSTLTFFINGRKFVGDRPIDYFRKIIDEELKNAE